MVDKIRFPWFKSGKTYKEGLNDCREYYENKSGIMRNFTDDEPPAISPHWPGVGRYVGVVDDEKPILFDTGEDFNCFDYYDKKDWQKRRIYSDEVPMFKTRFIKQKYYGKSIPEIFRDLNKELDKSITKLINGEN